MKQTSTGANSRKGLLMAVNKYFPLFFLFICAICSCFSATAQTLTPSRTFTIEANTNTVWTSSYNRYGNFIFPNGRIGLTMNNNQFRLYGPDGTLVRTIDLNTAAGFAPYRVIGLRNNRILLLRQTSFAIIDQEGIVTTPETSVGISNYANNFNLDAVELSNGNLAFVNYNSAGANEVRIMTQGGAAVTSPLNVQATGTGRPAPLNNQFYEGNLVASKDGGFLFAYRTYQMGIWGVLFNNDGTMRTWPSNGMNHRKLSPGNEEYTNLNDLPNGGYMLQFGFNKTSNVIIDGNGNNVSASVARSYNSAVTAINHKSANGYYVTVATGENIGQSWDGSDDFTGNAGIYAEARHPDGSVAIPSTQIGTGYFDVKWNEEEYWYTPDIRPAVYAVSSLVGGNGGYGLIIQNYNSAGTHYSLTMHLYEISASVLPVQLESFTGKATAGGNLLRWTTDSETRVQKFEIEYSATGTVFSKIGELTAGNPDYSYLHATASQPACYYRLRMIDADGSAEYSKVIRIVSSGEAGVKVSTYPIPATGYCWVEISGLQPGVRLPYRIMSTSGAEVQKGVIFQPREKLSLTGITAGIYYLHLTGYETQRIIVQ